MKTWHRAVNTAVLLAAMTALTGSCSREPRFGWDFEHESTLDKLDWKCRTLLRLSPEHATSGKQSLEVSFYPARADGTERYPGIAFTRFDPAWAGHRALGFDVFNPGQNSLRLVLRIDDREAPSYADRFNRSLDIHPGMNQLSIPLVELATSSTNRALDLRRIRAVALFMSNPGERHTIYLDRVRLD